MLITSYLTSYVILKIEKATHRFVSELSRKVVKIERTENKVISKSSTKVGNMSQNTSSKSVKMTEKGHIPNEKKTEAISSSR